MYFIAANVISLPVQRYDPEIWPTCARTEHDHQQSDGLHLRCPWAQALSMESGNIEPSLFRHLHRGNSQQRGSPAKLLWIYRRDSSSNLQTLPEPKNSLQWPQEGALFKVPVPDVTKWSHSQLVWPSLLVMENHSIFICRLDVVI